MTSLEERFVHYKTGLPDIDEQHFNILQEMENIITGHLSSSETVQNFERLLKLFHDHLEYEEALMEKINYKFIEYHKEQHKTLRRKIDALMRDYRVAIPFHKHTALQTMEEFFFSHIDHADRQIPDHADVAQ